MITDLRKVRFRMRLLGRWATAITVSVLAISLVACGQSSSGTGQSSTTRKSTTVSGTTTSSGAKSEELQAMLQYSQCMRANGVPDFPDPNANGQLVISSTKSKNGGTTGIDMNSAAFKNAQKVCADKLPAGLQSGSAQANSNLQTQMLEYAKCMRANGVPSFPDPQVSNGRVTMTLPAGVDRNSDAFKNAQAVCVSKLPGALGGH